MTTSTQKFSCYLGKDDLGNMRMRLGPLTYILKGRNFYIERSEGLELVTLEMHVTRPWIRSNFEKEAAYQRRKQLAIDLQSSHIPSYERKAFNRAKGTHGWSNTRGWN